jgi:hypothetical protein
VKEPAIADATILRLGLAVPAGWVVRVTTSEPLSGYPPAPEIWDVAISDPDEAVREVSERIRRVAEHVEAVQELSAETIKGFGLERGQAKQRL